MKALESSAALRAISTLVEDCREPRRGEGQKISPSELSQNVGYGYKDGLYEYTSRATGTCHYASSHTLHGQSERRLAFDPKRPKLHNSFRMLM